VLPFVSFIDRATIGFAALAMNKNLGLSPAQFGSAPVRLTRLPPVPGATQLMPKLGAPMDPGCGVEQIQTDAAVPHR
jgi:hypothetical protein